MKPIKVYISKDSAGNAAITVESKLWTLQKGMWYVLSQLTDEQKMYAGSRDREYRGFPALHDTCDANMLLPCTHLEIDNMDDCFEYWNDVMNTVTGFLICYADINEDLDDEEY